MLVSTFFTSLHMLLQPIGFVVNVLYGFGDTVGHAYRPLQIKNQLLEDGDIGKVLGDIVEMSKDRWPIEFTFDADFEESSGFKAFKESKISIVMANHVGGNDFMAVLDLFKRANRLNDIRFVTFESFTNPPLVGKFAKVRKEIQSIFDKFDAVLLPDPGKLTKAGKDAKTVIREYAESKIAEVTNYAIVIFPEGRLLEKKAYSECKQFMSSKMGLAPSEIWQATCAPKVNGVELLINGIPDADIFDITLQYTYRGSGLASEDSYPGDIFDVKSVFFRNLHPQKIYSKIDLLDKESIMQSIKESKQDKLMSLPPLPVNSEANERSSLFQRKRKSTITMDPATARSKSEKIRNHWLNRLWTSKNEFLVNKHNEDLQSGVVSKGKQKLGKCWLTSCIDYLKPRPTKRRRFDDK